MPRWHLSPATMEKWRRFRSLRRGYWSAGILAGLLMLSCGAELLVNNRALVVSYHGELYFPTYAGAIPGTTFGLDYDYETDYKMLKRIFSQQGSSDWLLLPPIPYSPYENDLKERDYPPYAPSLADKHYLGTDSSGRDVAARLIYGFRIAMGFALVLLFFNYLIGVSLGVLMGYLGGTFDLLLQRLIEIWSNIPFLYVVMIVAALVAPGFSILAAVMALFGWMAMTWYMRSAAYREAARQYVTAARALGASNTRIVVKHILPNIAAVFVTFVPFTIASGISAITALDYLGFGLPPPTPSWGELLRQGTNNLHAPWIVFSAVGVLAAILLLVNFVGEAVRETFDPKRLSTFE